MALANPPRWNGLLTVTAGVNDRIDWLENDGLTPTSVSCTVTAGSYYIGASSSETGSLLKAIADAMTAASLASGLGIVISASISTSGVVTITSDLIPWYPKITSAESDQLLTGKETATGAGEQGSNHLGWVTDAAYPADNEYFTADGAIDNCWYPDMPEATYNPNIRESMVVESISLTGDVQTYDFGGSDVYLQIYEMGYQLLGETAKDDYIDFWLSYAKQGSPNGRFRYYHDRAVDSYVELVLTGDSLRTARFERRAGYAYYSTNIQARRYKA